jgi:Putative transposase
VDGPRLGKRECAVIVDGFNVYAGYAIDGRDRKRIERMCRYLARPPIGTVRTVELRAERFISAQDKVPTTFGEGARVLLPSLNVPPNP